MELFRRIAIERQSCVMVVTHDPRSLDLFDRVIELEDGRIISEVTGKSAANFVQSQPLASKGGNYNQHQIHRL